MYSVNYHRATSVADAVKKAKGADAKFLSGGMTDEQATSRLTALNRTGPQPWQLSFSFGRALQGPVLRAWAGDDAKREAAQRALLHRAELNSAARYGRVPVEA